METVTNKTVKIISRNHKYATTYGGDIREFDFFTSGTSTNKVVDKIVAAWNFDKTCYANIKSRPNA